MPTVLISGYYGFRNLGDEAVLAGLLAGLRADAPEVTPVVLSADPAATEADHGVRAIPRMALLGDVRAALSTADLLVSGGGSLLQDVTSVRSPLYYLGVLELARRAGVPAVMLGQGVGPLNRGISRILARRGLNALRAITVRDQGSAAYLRDLGVTVPPEVTADLALLLEPETSDALDAWWATRIPERRPVLGVALRAWQAGASADRYTAICDALATFARETGALLLFIPMQQPRDLEVAHQVAGWTPAESRVLDLPLAPRAMLNAIGRCDFLLAMRLHALIFAVHRGVSALGISYDPKVRDFAREAALPEPLDWDTVTPATLGEALRTAWTARHTARLEVRRQAEALRLRARRNIAVMRDALAAPRG